MTSDPYKCKSCGADICRVQVLGERYVICDWPPTVPVCDFSRFLVAMPGDYHEPRGGKMVRADLVFEGFALPGPVAAILVERHDCEAERRYGARLTPLGLTRAVDPERRGW